MACPFASLYLLWLHSLLLQISLASINQKVDLYTTDVSPKEVCIQKYRRSLHYMMAETIIYQYHYTTTIHSCHITFLVEFNTEKIVVICRGYYCICKWDICQSILGMLYTGQVGDLQIITIFYNLIMFRVVNCECIHLWLVNIGKQSSYLIYGNLRNGNVYILKLRWHENLFYSSDD